jgi:hypothetical protein
MPPQCIQQGPPNDAQEKVILGNVRQGVALLKVPEAAQITLKCSDQVVPVPGDLVPQVSLLRSPVKAILISCNMIEEVVIRVWVVAPPVPHRFTGPPV